MLMIFEMSTPPLVELGLANPFCVSWCMLCLLIGPSGPYNSGKRGLQTVLNAHEPDRPQLLIFSEIKCVLSLSQSSEFLSEHTCMV